MSGKTRAQSSHQQQPSVEPGNDSEELPGSLPNDQLISAASAASAASAGTHNNLPGFLNEQVDGVEQLFTRKFNDFLTGVPNLQQQGQIQHSKEFQDPPPLPTTRHPEPPRNRRERRDLRFQRGLFSTPKADQHPHDSDNDDDF